jgi:DUF4097 and DUF4098 domain-containing protein YvlB
MYKPSFFLASLVLLGALLPEAATAQRRRSSDDDDVRSRIDTTYSFSRTGVVDLSLISGDIIVTGSGRDEIRVRAFSERGRIRMDASSSRLTLDIESDRGRMGDTRFEVAVPAGVRVLMRSTSGDLSAKGVRGPVEAHTTSGDIVVDEATDRVSLESVSGDVRATRLSGDIRIESVSGDCEIDNLAGDIRVESTSGGITLGNVTSKNVYATTVSGEVSYDGNIDANGRYEFHSHSGDVRLDIPSSVSARFSVETFSGSLDSDFEVTLQPGQSVGRRPRRFELNVGNGGARVTAETFSGDIVLRRAGRSTR